MQWLSENWILVLFGGGMIAMHLFGHGHGGKSGSGGSGGGGGGCCGGKKAKTADLAAEETIKLPPSSKAM